jgi:hypothetical protein
MNAAFMSYQPRESGIHAVWPVAAGGAVRQAKTARLLSGQEWIESLRKAQGSHYHPAR